MIERFRQWSNMKQRGELRVAPYPQTGRVFISKHDSERTPLSNLKYNTKAELTVTARVIRKDGTIEEINLHG